ncbi:hypothetical protein [Streptacidiphilus monticola]|uniref:DUF4164 family protein n=1 Tax=Streptacidiphilus monticola TaxID=2161674 RepID=A0ABW1G3D0_9ACTN
MTAHLTEHREQQIRAMLDDEHATACGLLDAVADLLAEVERQRETIGRLERTRDRADTLAGRLRVQRDAARQVAHLLAGVTA